MLKSAYGLAAKLNVTPEMSKKSADLDKEFKKDIEDLKAKKDGREFDKEFMDEQIDLHEEAIDVLKDLNEDDHGRDPEGRDHRGAAEDAGTPRSAEGGQKNVRLSARWSTSQTKPCESYVRADRKIGPSISRE